MNTLFNQFENLTCLIIGDVMVDAYIWGEVNRISPEAPVPVFEVSKRENRLGGAANVALNVQSLGAKPILCGVIGDDIKGKVFEELMKKRGLEVDGLVKSDGRPTTSKTRIISSSHHLLRVDEEVCQSISEQVKAALLDRVKSTLEKGVHVVIFEDYDKGVLSEDLIRSIVQLCQKKGIPTCVDPKKDNFNAYAGVSLFKPNFKEFVTGLKTEVNKGDFETLADLAKNYLKKANIESVLLTLSEDGMLLVSEDKVNQVPAMLRNIADVSGAGDTVISTAALVLAAGGSPSEVLKIANLAGGLVCEEVGVVPIKKEVLEKEYQSIYQ